MRLLDDEKKAIHQKLDELERRIEAGEDLLGKGPWELADIILEPLGICQHELRGKARTKKWREAHEVTSRGGTQARWVEVDAIHEAVRRLVKEMAERVFDQVLETRAARAEAISDAASFRLILDGTVHLRVSNVTSEDGDGMVFIIGEEQIPPSCRPSDSWSWVPVDAVCEKSLEVCYSDCNDYDIAAAAEGHKRWTIYRGKKWGVPALLLISRPA